MSMSRKRLNGFARGAPLGNVYLDSNPCTVCCSNLKLSRGAPMTLSEQAKSVVQEWYTSVQSSICTKFWLESIAWCLLVIGVMIKRLEFTWPVSDAVDGVILNTFWDRNHKRCRHLLAYLVFSLMHNISMNLSVYFPTEGNRSNYIGN